MHFSPSVSKAHWAETTEHNLSRELSYDDLKSTARESVLRRRGHHRRDSSLTSLHKYLQGPPTPTGANAPKVTDGIKEGIPERTPAFVIDTGSGSIKAGFGTDSRPLTFATLVGRPKYQRVMIGSRRLRKVVVGRRAKRIQGVLKLSYPITADGVQNWNDLQKLWEYAYEDNRAYAMRHPVLLTEQPLTLMKDRLKTAEVFFEAFQAPSLCFQLPQVLGLYAVGHTTGLVLDSGDTTTSAVPIYEGRYDPATVATMKLAGRDVTTYLSKLLRLTGCNLMSSSEFEEVKRIKHKMCSTAFNLGTALKDFDINRGMGYKLPDGNLVKIGLERFQAPELLFNPSLMGREEPGIHELVIEAIAKSKPEDRRQIYSQIILAGGSTTSKGFELRLMNSIRRLGPENKKAQQPAATRKQHSLPHLPHQPHAAYTFNKLRISAPERRAELAWVGGSILTTLSLFDGMSTSRADFMEMGAQAFYKKRAQDGPTSEDSLDRSFSSFG